MGQAELQELQEVSGEVTLTWWGRSTDMGLRFPNWGPWMGRKGKHLVTEREEKGTAGQMEGPGFEVVGLGS